MCNVKPVLLSGMLFFCYGLFAQSPGGVPQQSYWLRGTAAANVKSSLNFNPAIDLSNRKDRIKLPGSLQSLRKATIFTVYQNPGAGEETPVWEMAGRFGDLQLTTKQVSSKSGNTNLVFARNKPAASEALIHTYVGRIKRNADNTEDEQASIRLTQPSISEIILYQKVLAETDINKVESYLALKYGITLRKNYLNAAGEVVWNFKLDSNYSNNIAGIARDDQSALYQKQATSSNTPNQLVIAIDKLAASNSENTGTLNDKHFLIWGDNDQPFTLKEDIAEKKWLLKRSGNNADKISTELKIDASTLLAANLKDSFYLIIDRSGTAEFTAENCTYITPYNISAEGIASFKNVFWDADGSGKDAFTFGIKSAILLAKNGKDAAKMISFQLYPNPVTDGQFKMAVTLDKPADIQVQIYDIHQRLVHSAKATGQSYYLLPAHIRGAAGSYTIRVTTPQTEYSRIIIVQ